MCPTALRLKHDNCDHLQSRCRNLNQQDHPSFQDQDCWMRLMVGVEAVLMTIGMTRLVSRPFSGLLKQESRLPVPAEDLWTGSSWR
jgi:hypothetical protein